MHTHTHPYIALFSNTHTHTHTQMQTHKHAHAQRENERKRRERETCIHTTGSERLGNRCLILTMRERSVSFYWMEAFLKLLHALYITCLIVVVYLIILFDVFLLPPSPFLILRLFLCLLFRACTHSGCCRLYKINSIHYIITTI